MKKYILILLLFPLISNAQWSIQNYQFNVTDSGSVGIGIKTPTSRLHVFGNGTASNLLNVTNDKDATKDSSVVIDAIGNVGIGKTPYTKLDVNGFVNVDSSLTVDQNIYLSGLLSKISFNRGGYISSPGINCKFTGMGIDIDSAHHFAIHHNRVLSSDNDTTISLGNFHLNLDNYTGKVGIGTTTPTYRLDIGEGGTEAIRNEVLRINSADNNELSNSIILLARGDTTRTTIATSSTNNLFIKGSKENDLCIKTESNNILFSANDDDELDIKIDTNGNLNIYEEIIWRDGVGDYVKGITLSDNNAFEFPTGYSWKGEIDVDSLGFTLFTAQLRCDATGTPYLEGVSWKRWSSKTYIKMGSEDGYFNVIDGVSRMIIANSLGYTIKATLRFRTKQ